jgi:hypothetical protein
MPLKPSDLETLRALVKDHMTALSLISLGPETAQVDPADVKRLVDAGILDPAAVGALDPVADMYLLGFASRKLEQLGIDPHEVTIETFRQFVTDNPLPLSTTEEAAIEYARTRAGQYAVGFGDAHASEVVNAVLDEQAKTMIREQTAESIAARETPGALASRLGHESEDWARDWSRIAHTEMKDAQSHGYAESLKKDFGPATGIRVARLPNADACPKCRELYLVRNAKPRIFTLAELEANGTNKGRKQKEWLATLGPIHPWCACETVFVPNGFELDPDGHIIPIESDQGEELPE